MKEHPVLSSVARNGIRLGLDRMRGFLRTLDRPHRAYPVVHVAGTNGKGSACAFVSEVLRAQGFRVGLYTSPHLQRVNERIRVDGREIGDKTLAALFDEIDELRTRYQDEMDDLGDSGEPLTYFELLTTAAFLYFKRVNVDVAVVEVGLGGRLDATNLVDPVVSVITSVGLDHTDQLGPDHASVAGEKAGIFKPGRPAVVGAVPVDAVRVIRTIANERGVPVWFYGDDFQALGDARSFSWRGSGTVRKDLSIRMNGDHQVENAAVALAALDHLPVNLAVEESAIRTGLQEASLPGRLEWMAPDLLADCAHNADAALTLAAYLRARPRKGPRSLLMGASREKDVRAIGAILAPHVDRVFTTACSHPRAMAPGEVAAALECLSVPVMPAGRVEEALPLARSGGGETIVGGSVFLAGAVRDLVGLP